MKNFVKKLCLGMLVTVFAILCANTMVSMANDSSLETMRYDSRNLYGESNRNYWNEVNNVSREDVVDIFCYMDDITIEETGMVEFVDVIGKCQDGTYITLTTNVTAQIENDEIAEWCMGKGGAMVKARNSGDTKLSITYNECIVEINIHVNNTVDLDNIAQLIQSEKSNKLRSVPGPDYSDVMRRAAAMKNVTWTPVQDLILRNGAIAPAGVQQTGVPYSQTPTQVNATEFIARLEDGLSNGFYTSEPAGNNKYNPAYGVDCSGLVSFSWGIPRHTTSGFFNELKKSSSTKFEKIGSYSIASSANVTTGVAKSDLLASYSLLTTTSAVVRRIYNTNNVVVGHSMLVVSNQPSSNKCLFEEAYYNFPSYITLTYDQLADAGYCPFTVKESYYFQYNE